jgi:hypothetical protein
MFDTHGGFAGLVSSILDLFNVIIPVLGAAALVFFMYGVFQYVAHAGKKNSSSILWSLITLFVFFSVWGILRILENTFL